MSCPHSRTGDDSRVRVPGSKIIGGYLGIHLPQKLLEQMRKSTYLDSAPQFTTKNFVKLGSSVTTLHTDKYICMCNLSWVCFISYAFLLYFIILLKLTGNRCHRQSKNQCQECFKHRGTSQFPGTAKSYLILPSQLPLLHAWQ